MKIKIINRKALLLIFLSIVLQNTSIKSQFEKRGVLKRNTYSSKKGGSVLVCGRRYNKNSQNFQYLIKDPDFKFINASKIALIETEYDFWQDVWFNNRAVEVRKNGWEYQNRVKQDASEFYNQLIQNNLIYYDDFFNDYLYHLVNKIHPTKLIKKTPSNFSIVIIKSAEEKYFVFDNGLIILTTALIANTQTEKELVTILAKCITHVVLEHNIVNIKSQIQAQNRAEFWGGVAAVASSAALAYGSAENDWNFTAEDIALVGVSAYLLAKSMLVEVGANYSNEQLSKCSKTANDYLVKNEQSFVTKDIDYLKKIAGIISYVAWQNYYSLDYFRALELINRIRKNDLLTAEDYLLLVKLKRLLNSSDETSRELLSLISTAREIGGGGLIELFKEEALIYIRLGKNNEARESLIKFRSGLERLQKQGQNVLTEINSVEQILKRL